jgi:hypothetical protein
MLTFLFANYGFGVWSTWAALAAGALVSCLVFGTSAIFGRWRKQRLSEASREEDLPWEEFQALLDQRNQDREAAGLPPEEATPEELEQILAKLPALADPRPLELPEDREFKLVEGSERRAGYRRWGNPTQVLAKPRGSEDELHGLVVNRSTGGLGILADKEVAPGSFVSVRAVDAPSYVPSVWVEIRHCLKAGRGFVLGCQFCSEIPWNVRVWFG